MDYTILVCDNVQSGGKASLNKSGNKYYVYYSAPERGGAVGGSRLFETYEEAFAVFSELADVIGRGNYSDEQRVEMLKNK